MHKLIIYIFLVATISSKSQTNCNYWSTYIGKTDADEVKGIAVDNAKNSYIIMQTQSQSLTTTPALISSTLVGFYDAYIAKFDSCGSFIWGTYLGTAGFDSGEKIVICPDGNIAFTGSSQSGGLPTNTLSSFQPTFAGQSDCFVGKISPNGNLIWLSYFGKSNYDLAFDIACDFNGNLFIGGTTTSSNLYTNASSFQQTFGGNTDAFIAKFSSGGVLKWCTYYGGAGTEDIHALSTDNNGNIFGCGGTNSFNLNTSINCLQSAKDVGIDCYLIKLDSLGVRVFSTYMGGVGIDDCYGLATDNIGNVYIGGQTTSTNFTTTTAAYQPTLVGMEDLFISKLSSTGNLVFSTFFGGSTNDATARLKFYNNQLYVFATTASSNLPMLGTQTYSTLTANQNFAVVRFNTNGTPNYSTYFGSTNFGSDYANDFEVKNNHLYLSGKTTSTNYPTTNNAFQTLYGYNDDGVLTRLPLVLNTVTTINNNFLKPEISLYPNPTNEFIYLKGKIIEQHHAVIYNTLGQLQIDAQILNNKIDVLQLKEGLYFLKLEDFTYKFIKE